MMNRQREGVNDRQASLIGQRLTPQRLLLLELLHQKENLEARNECHITGTKVLLVGYCAGCLKRKENKV